MLNSGDFQSSDLEVKTLSAGNNKEAPVKTSASLYGLGIPCLPSEPGLSPCRLQNRQPVPLLSFLRATFWWIFS